MYGISKSKKTSGRLFAACHCGRSIATRKKLIETEIAEKLAVSRSPVRSAFKELADMGLVEMVPNKGAYVAAKSLTPKEYVERLEFLELLLIQFLFYQEKRSELLNERALSEILKKLMIIENSVL